MLNQLLYLLTPGDQIRTVEVWSFIDGGSVRLADRSGLGLLMFPGAVVVQQRHDHSSESGTDWEWRPRVAKPFPPAKIPAGPEQLREPVSYLYLQTDSDDR